jgi:hypothetical protein
MQCPQARGTAAVGGRFIGFLLWGKIAAFSVLTDPVQEESEVKEHSLLLPLAIRFELLTLQVTGVPLAIAAWRWAAGNAAAVHWPEVATNLVSWIALAVLWTKIKTLNLAAVDMLKDARNRG